MQLEGARAELRSRPPQEAADLGVQLLRALFRPALWAWLGFVLPLQLCVLAACSSSALASSYLAIWWLKPLYDRAWGLVIGHGLFGDPPRLRALYRGLWSAGRRGLLGDLLWRRLDPARTLVAPVSLLEGLSGSTAARRRRALSEGHTRTVWQLLSACVLLELATLAGLCVAGSMLLPDEARWFVHEHWDLDASEWIDRMILGGYVLAIGVVEPLFVAAGFGLYINRRTDLEGWDVELTFRRMARRLSAQGAGSEPARAARALLFALACAWPAGARAAPPAEAPSLQSVVQDDTLRVPAPVPEPDAGAAAAMARVLARPELARTHLEERWELRYTPSADEQPSALGKWLAELAAALAGGLAQGIELVLWLLAGAALVVAIYLIVQRGQRALARRATQPALPEVARQRGLDPKDIELPTHAVVPRALALLAQGQHAAALSVLYVGTLAALVRQDQLDLPRQATEGQCLDVVRAAPIAEERRALFVELTQLWQLSAYAHLTPDDARLQGVCARFGACFGAPA